jgi:eukaryotic-like serine/threonine-protein kinase
MAESPAASRKMISSRSGWRAMGHDEESRARLQERLIALSRLMFWSFAVLALGMMALYWKYPTTTEHGGIQPIRQGWINLISAAGVVSLAIVWRGVLVRRDLELRYLYAIDLFYAFSTGAIFASAAFLASDLVTSGWINLLWSCFIVFLRAIMLPSTGRQTAIAGTLTFIPMVLAIIGLSVVTTPELPRPAFIAGGFAIATLVISLATISSRLIYGLRKQVDAAMRLGQYTLDTKIGAGGNGTVYRAHHALLRRPTAIKLMQPDKIGAETIDRFEREVQHMSQLTHWNTVAVYDYGRNPDGFFYYAMEYLDGINLQDLIVDFGPQPADRVISILAQVCAALNEAHRRNITHRDIKPANIILCERGDVPDVAKVVDFGLAKEIDGNTNNDTTQTILGTPAYIAPEAVTDPGSIGPSVDLYAVGAVGYFLLTGRRVFDAKTSLDLCVQHVIATPKPMGEMTNRKIPAELEALIMRCLAKTPAGRPESASELARLLRALPLAGDWSDADAVDWWSDFRRKPRLSGASTPTLTISVDIEAREALLGAKPAGVTQAARTTDGDANQAPGDPVVATAGS